MNHVARPVIAVFSRLLPGGESGDSKGMYDRHCKAVLTGKCGCPLVRHLRGAGGKYYSARGGGREEGSGLRGDLQDICYYTSRP